MERDRDKELDNLFKSAMQDSEHTDFREEDWASMEAMLNGRGKGRVMWLRLASGIAALLLLFAGWYMLRTPDMNKPKKHEIVQKNTPRPSIKNDTAAPVTSSRSQQNEIYDNPVEKAIVVQEYVPENKSFNVDYIKQNEQVEIEPSIAENIRVDSSTYAAANQPVPVTQIPVAAAIDSVSQQQEVLAIAEPPVKEASKQSIKIKQPGVKNGPVFTLSVIAAPDVNGVNSFRQSKAGSNFGVLLSVGLGKKFTVSTGAVYAYKPYATGSQTYTNPYSAAVSGQNVLADCRVLDIPLNIDYSLYSKQRNSISIGTGLSSYLMLNEKYTFGNAASPAIDISNQNKHLFGVLNLQATYTRRINSRFGVSVQPFMKLPLTNIGYGNVRLRSAGVAAGFSWNITRPPNTRR